MSSDEQAVRRFVAQKLIAAFGNDEDAADRLEVVARLALRRMRMTAPEFAQAWAERGRGEATPLAWNVGAQVGDSIGAYLQELLDDIRRRTPGSVRAALLAALFDLLDFGDRYLWCEIGWAFMPKPAAVALPPGESEKEEE